MQGRNVICGIPLEWGILPKLSNGQAKSTGMLIQVYLTELTLDYRD